MKSYKNTDIIGTSHIAAQSIKEINDYFKKQKPKHVAVELDAGRLHGLMSKAKPSLSPSNILSLGLFGYFFMLIGHILQQKLGRLVGIEPGSDMLHAVRLAKENKLRVYLIDRDIAVTIRRLSKEFSFREKLRLIWDFLRAPFMRKEFGFETNKISLSKVPEKEIIKKILVYLKKRYPGIHKVLIEERNEVMAKRILFLINNFPEEKILVVVGAGHEEGLFDIISNTKRKL
ncbi:TraB/GumN family protein [Candidatus Woesearchaeota archaeon]|nr:TraB/GumN family protein [Candidatus Woesearchaeota archaeon]